MESKCLKFIRIMREPYMLFSLTFRTKTPGPGAQSALRALARSGMKIGRIGMFSPELSSSEAWALFTFQVELTNEFVVVCRGRHPHSIRQHPQKGRSSWTSSVNYWIFFRIKCQIIFSLLSSFKSCDLHWRRLWFRIVQFPAS